MLHAEAAPETTETHTYASKQENQIIAERCSCSTATKLVHESWPHGVTLCTVTAFHLVGVAEYAWETR